MDMPAISDAWEGSCLMLAMRMDGKTLMASATGFGEYRDGKPFVVEEGEMLDFDNPCIGLDDERRVWIFGYDEQGQQVRFSLREWGRAFTESQGFEGGSDSEAERHDS